MTRGHCRCSDGPQQRGSHTNVERRDHTAGPEGWLGPERLALLKEGKEGLVLGELGGLYVNLQSVWGPCWFSGAWNDATVTLLWGRQ